MEEVLYAVGVVIITIVWISLVERRYGQDQKQENRSDKSKEETLQQNSKEMTKHDIRSLLSMIEHLKESRNILIAQRDEACSLMQESLKVIENLRNDIVLLKQNKMDKDPDQKKFRKLKAAFARLYHPDRAAGSDIERLIREQFFKEFWKEIEKIEKENE